jgi:hypothetical protein
MKRTIPMAITTAVGFVLIVAYFIPATQFLGEFAAVSFDILAGIAFILGGGNLLKTHLKKISVRQAGWGYSVVTLVSFLVMLVIGLGKLGTPPARDQQYYGQSLAALPLRNFPESQWASVAGTIPDKPQGDLQAPSVRRQISQQDGRIVFRGWMLSNQRQDLMNFDQRLDWQSRVERLSEAAQPPEPLRGRVSYYADVGRLAFRGVMSDDDRDRLLSMSDGEAWQQAVAAMYRQSRTTATVSLGHVPPPVAIPAELQPVVSLDRDAAVLQATGPLSLAQRDRLARQFPPAKPFSPAERAALRQQVEARGDPLTPRQEAAFRRTLAALWSVDQLATLLDEAGRAPVVEKSASQMLAEMQAGERDIEPRQAVGSDVRLSERQRAALEQFARQPDSDIDQLMAALESTGAPLADRQQAAARTFLADLPTRGQLRAELGLALLSTGPLSPEQREFLFAQRQGELDWYAVVQRLFQASNPTRFPWSGDYGTQGSPFWWMYEYVFKPCTATMFSMLAFYVASAAFRAFRAKNLEAVLLLGTAFIVLLGRTFAGVWLTDWLPESLSWLRMENLTVMIMSVFTTAGNRAIMIGIALGIASTSLKVLLGIDRSYLGRE